MSVGAVPQVLNVKEKSAAKRLVVFGSTGMVGRQLSGILAARGHQVIAPLRDPSLPCGTGVEPRRVDLRSATDFSALLDGADGIFVLAGFRRSLTSILRDAPSTARFVLLSAAVAAYGDRNPLSAVHAQAEAQIQARTDNWTMLRPQMFASNTAAWRHQLSAGDTVALRFPDLPVACIAPRDIAAVGAAALTEPAHSGETYRLSGPTALLPREQLGLLARVLGRPLQPLELSDVEARNAMLAESPQPIVDSLFDLYRHSDYSEAVVTTGVEAVLGRRATPFERWAAENRRLFGGGL